MAAAPVSLIVAGSAFAVPPTGFSFDPNTVGGFTATAGAVTSDCAAGFTCTTLVGSGTGILQERAVNDTNPDEQYFHTIVVEDSADTSGTLTFFNNSFIDANNSTTGSADNVGIKSFVRW